MSAQRYALGALVMVLVASLAWTASAAGPTARPASTNVPSAGDPLTVHVNLDMEPASLDPALAWDSTSISVIEQLFSGLVDLDDETSAVLPDLATSWAVSADDTVYTFTLRSDAVWTDGHPVTAEDVRYGILRTLDPQTAANGAYILSIIYNAAAYNSGTITDSNLVGVTAVNTTTLRVTLGGPASFATTVLAMTLARPMPQWTIEAYGTPTWTYPANIVTNGPYRLSEWVADDHILLDKNPTYYDAAGVQIERAYASRMDTTTAWSAYLDGQLDTATVPGSASLDAVQPQEIHIVPSSCIYYYGFTLSQPPFDNVLVRRAFAAALDRHGVIRDATANRGQRPALTLTPPGILGYVDGYAEGVGLPYNVAQARQWLAEAGYPGGVGLPPVALSFNTSTGHQVIAERVQEAWYETLGVSVTLQSLDWSEYLSRMRNGELQVWRNGWCMDFPEAFNYLGGAILGSVENFGNWDSGPYADLMDQALRQEDPALRGDLYRQAEEILVEDDAVLIPVYYYGSLVVTKPYLERTYSVAGAVDIATWRLTRSRGTVGPTGGDLVAYNGTTTVTVPAGALTATVVMTLSPAYGLPPANNLLDIGHVFDLDGVYSDTGEPAQPAPGQTYSITVRYTDAEEGAAIESTLGLYYWNGSQWERELTSAVDTVANIVTATPSHFSRWAVLGETQRIYLPLVFSGYLEVR